MGALCHMLRCSHSRIAWRDPFWDMRSVQLTSSDAFHHVSTAPRPDLGSTLTEMRAGDVDVSHYHFTSWPDHGVPVPKDQPALQALVLEVGRRQREERKEVWVHWYVAQLRRPLLSLTICPGPLHVSSLPDRVGAFGCTARPWLCCVLQAAGCPYRDTIRKQPQSR